MAARGICWNSTTAHERAHEKDVLHSRGRVFLRGTFRGRRASDDMKQDQSQQDQIKHDEMKQDQMQKYEMKKARRLSNVQQLRGFTIALPVQDSSEISKMT